MLEIGSFIKKGDKEYCLLDILKYDNKDYYFFSIEKEGKLDYRFFTCKSYSEKDGYDFEPLNDEDLFMDLFDKEVEKLRLTDAIDIPYPEDIDGENTSVD